jgi:hypothetical protein
MYCARAVNASGRAMAVMMMIRFMFVFLSLFAV